MNPGGVSPPCIDLHLGWCRANPVAGWGRGWEAKYLPLAICSNGTQRHLEGRSALPLAPVGGAYLAAPGNDLRSVQALGVRPRAGAGPGGTSSQPVNRRRGRGADLTAV